MLRFLQKREDMALLIDSTRRNVRATAIYTRRRTEHCCFFNECLDERTTLYLSFSSRITANPTCLGTVVKKKIAANLHVFLVLKTPAPIDTTRLTTRRSLARSAERETRWPKLARAATPCAARLPGLAGRRHVTATPQRPTGPHVRGTTPQSPLQVNFSGLGDGESTMPCLPPARAHPSQSLQKLNPRAIAATHLSPRSGSAA